MSDYTATKDERQAFQPSQNNINKGKMRFYVNLTIII